MSYRKEDHFPPPLRECTICENEFEPNDRFQKVCNSCYQELNDEYPEDEEEDEECWRRVIVFLALFWSLVFYALVYG